MTGQVGRAVRVRHMPHHTHEVEVFDAHTAEHLGAATLADQASPDQIAELRKARETRAKALKTDLRAAEKARRARYAAATTPAPAQPVSAVTTDEATAELADAAVRLLPYKDVDEVLCPGDPQFVESEQTERDIGQILKNSGYEVQEDYASFHNGEGSCPRDEEPPFQACPGRADSVFGSRHMWQNSGYATYIKVP